MSRAKGLDRSLGNLAEQQEALTEVVAGHGEGVAADNTDGEGSQAEPRAHELSQGVALGRQGSRQGGAPEQVAAVEAAGAAAEGAVVTLWFFPYRQSW